jgi:predicted RNA-binding protein (virulence factor B family)
MAILGKPNVLTVLKDRRPGLYLDGGDLGEILLPGDSIPQGAGPGDQLEVFTYRDSEDRLVASTRMPVAFVGDFAALEVRQVNPRMGAFLDWGLNKDLLLPMREQEKKVRVGETVVVFIFVDEKSGRIVASTRLSEHIDTTPPPYTDGSKVSLLIASPTPLGYNAVIDNSRLGLLYRSEIGMDLHVGEKYEGYVRSVRPDGKIDLGLDPQGYRRVAPLANEILKALRAGKGRLALSDRSSPEDIRIAFQTSKKAFKQALGSLYRQQLIEINDDGVTLKS